MKSSAQKERPSTKDNLLEVATRLFAQHGFDGTSLREITAQAKANLASVNYHFGSKDGLIAILIKTHLDPVNQERLRMLDEAEARSAPNPVPVEAICDAYIQPLLNPRNCTAEERALIQKLLIRFVSEPPENMRRIAMETYDPVLRRFKQAIQRSLPQLSADDVCWRMHLAAGATLRAVAQPQLLEFISEGRLGGIDPAEAARQTALFVCGGLRS